jgi:hypothetical protein
MARRVCPSVARVITASVIAPIAPVVQACSAPVGAMIAGQRIATPSAKAPNGTKA